MERLVAMGHALEHQQMEGMERKASRRKCSEITWHHAKSRQEGEGPRWDRSHSKRVDVANHLNQLLDAEMDLV